MRCAVCDPETLTIILEYDHEPGGKSYWVARNPDLLGCLADGATPEEAVANLRLVRLLYLEHVCLHEALNQEFEGGCDD